MAAISGRTLWYNEQRWCSESVQDLYRVQIRKPRRLLPKSEAMIVIFPVTLLARSCRRETAMSSIFPQYGAVPTSPEEAEYAASTLDTHTHAGAPKGIQGGCAKAFFKFLEGGTIGPRFEQHMKARKPSIMPQDTLNIHAESLRFIAFVSFWFMCVAAVILTTILIKPETIEDSMLMYVFGYNSICVMWDYSPSRELVAMIYPMFEYFLFYILVDWLACKSGGVPGAAQWLYRFVVVCLPFKVMLVCWFRMMFIFQVHGLVPRQ